MVSAVGRRPFATHPGHVRHQGIHGAHIFERLCPKEALAVEHGPKGQQLIEDEAEAEHVGAARVDGSAD